MLDGLGVTQDYAAAAVWLRKAADQGYAESSNNLGTIYEQGEGVVQDYAAAVRWYRKAAGQGSSPAQYNLGRSYAIGHGVSQDYVQAHKWFDLSATGGTKAEARDQSAKARDAVATQMTPAQIAEAQRLASGLIPSLGARG